MTDVGERIAALEQDVSNLHQDVSGIHDEINSVKEQNVAIFKLASSLEILTHDFKFVQEKVNDISENQKQLNDKLDLEIDRVKGEQESFRERLEMVDNKGGKIALKFLGNVGSKAAWVVLGSILAFLLYQAFPFLKS